jgi:thiosulfate/3-mercaptopyruvate sulfurtransferase
MKKILVSPQWLSEHLDQPDTVVLDASLDPVGSTVKIGARERYEARHIPGARFFDISKLSEKNTDLPHMLPTADAFAEAMSDLGINERAFIVLYEQGGPFSAPRAWWMLRVFGAENVCLLDGGFDAWIRHGHAVQSTKPIFAPDKFETNFQSKYLSSINDINLAKSTGVQIVDARSSGRFSGALNEPRPFLSSGHCPGAYNIPFGDLLEGDRFKSAESLRSVFSQSGINLDQPIITMCGSGVTAAVVFVALQMAGAENVSLYDGSWAEYAADPGSIIIKGS